ncbi:hypothetical protein Acr_00g0045150 [Actinidia rufa]|uniref:Uncharacterized protein n=1 Tax=Actinidia rufa TaxID=165716 RepID=A0A7J0DKW4_9ERIC|nr:hypothetical protein Acr_00g0045150 [Actinidia rufa]
MYNRSRVGDLENLEDSLPSWIFKHLGGGSSYMTDEKNKLPFSPREDLPEASPPGMIPLTKGVTQDLGPKPRSWLRTILSIRLGEVAFYEAAFLAELRCVNTLLKNPKPDSGWLYFKARPSKNVFKGSPSNVKGWKSRFFFVSGDDWEILLNITSNEVPRVPRVWGTPNIEEARMRRVLQKIGLRGYFNIPNILDSRTFHRFFAPGRGQMSSSGGDKDMSKDGAVTTSGNRGTIKKERRRNLPPLPNLTMLRLLGGKVPDPLAMSKRISLAKLTKRVDDKKENEGSKVATSSNTGVVAPPPEAKKAKSSKAESKGVTPPVPPKGESSKRPSSKKPNEVLGEGASMYASPSMAEKILFGVILPANKEKVKKPSLDQVVTISFHILVQGFDFCKRQLARHHPNLGIDLDSMGLDHNLLAEEEGEGEEEEVEEGEKEEVMEKGNE